MRELGAVDQEHFPSSSTTKTLRASMRGCSILLRTESMGAVVSADVMRPSITASSEPLSYFIGMKPAG